jgi:hypothetical protein
VQPVKPGGDQQEAAEPAHQHGEPKPNRTHRGRASQKSHRIQRREADDGGDEDNRQSPTFLADKIKQFGYSRAEACPSGPNWTLLSDLAPMLDERKLLAFPYAKEEQQFSYCLPDRDTDRNGNGPGNGRHLRGDDVRLGVDDRYDRRHRSKADRGEQGNQFGPPKSTHLPTVPEVAGGAYLASAAR